MRITLLSAVIGYLLGSIPFGYLLVRIVRGQDVRATGSGNIGATNVSRTSRALGVFTLMLDAAKGASAVLVSGSLAHSQNLSAPSSSAIDTAAAIAALFAILGHIFPVWLKFRGGKGVATALGAYLLVAPFAMLAALGVFLVVAVASRYVSLSSIVTTALFPPFVWFFSRNGISLGAMASVCVASCAIIARHHQNIRRLLAATEPRFELRRR
jgi:acyl phosphate:glycerol-3-phosphate acyltransferase